MNAYGKNPNCHLTQLKRLLRKFDSFINEKTGGKNVSIEFQINESLSTKVYSYQMYKSFGKNYITNLIKTRTEQGSSSAQG